MAWELTSEDLPDLACGAAVLGSGGGGDPTLGRMLADRALARYGPVRVITPDELSGDALVIPTAEMGAPSVALERLPAGTEAVTALRALARHIGRSADATMSIESGGCNAMVPFLVAAQTGLPVVDADGMGRAFPELQMVTFAVHGVPGSPMAIADIHGSMAVFDTEADNHRLEWLARGLTVRMGGLVAMAIYPMDGDTVRRTAVPGTLSVAVRIGRAIRMAREEHRDPLQSLQEALADTIYRESDEIFSGKIVDVVRHTAGGFVRGHADIASHKGWDVCRVTFQNEHLLARIGKRTVAAVPDLIAVLEAETGEPITTERLRYGQRVRLVSISAPDVLRTPEALRLFGRGAFGLNE